MIRWIEEDFGKGIRVSICHGYFKLLGLISMKNDDQIMANRT